MNYKHTILVAFLFANLLSAQTKNTFLESDFWSTKPSIEVVEQKIDEGHDPTALTSNGFDAVVYAILQEAPNETIKYLLTKKGNPVNKLTHDKRTYAFWSAYKNNAELLQYLATQNADFSLRDSHHFSPLTFAAVAGVTNTDIYDICIKNGIDVKTDVDEHGANALLLLTPHLANFELVDYFTSKGLDLNSVDQDGNGVFNYTAKAGNKAMLELLIKKGVPYNVLNKKGENALFLATKGSRKGYNTLDYLKYLEALGLEANIINTDGKTPLHNLAYGNKDLETFSYFINKDVAVNQIDAEGNTAIINASSRNTLEIVSFLASKTDAINQVNKDGESALTKAISNTPEVVQFLIKKAADVHVIDAKGNNLGYYLLKSFRAKASDAFGEKLAALSNKGFNIKTSQKDGNSAYHLALDNRDALELLKVVHNFGVDINAKNNSGLTPLHKAVMQAKDENIIKYLLSIGAKKDIRTDFDETVYDLAKENEYLQNHQIDINFLK